MYFNTFPQIPYDNYGNGDFRFVTNLLRRVALRINISQNTSFFDTYDVKEGETPEMIAHKLYGESHLSDKYTNVDAVHHYEISQSSGDTNIKINIGTSNTDHPTATAITNREYEQERQDSLRKIRLLDPVYLDDFVTEFETLMEESSV
jgi:hypothetical protein